MSSFIQERKKAKRNYEFSTSQRALSGWIRHVPYW